MSVLKRSSYYLAGVLIALLGAELFFRSAEIDLAYHVLDPNLGKALQPGHPIIMLKDGFYLGAANEFGYLGPAYPRDRAEDTFRIALLGDSYTEGLHLAERYHFRTLLERTLRTATAQEVEVLNFGMGGFSFADSYAYLNTFAASFEPDLVVFTLAAVDFAGSTNFAPGPRPALVDEQVTLDYGFRDEPAYQTYRVLKPLIDHSSVFKVASNAVKLTQRGEAPQILFGKLAKLWRKTRSPTENPPFELSALTERMLQELGRRQTLLAFIGEVPAELRDAVTSAGLPSVLVDEAFVDLEAFGVHPRYWPATDRLGHWNHAGQAAVAELLAREILALDPEGLRR